MALHSASEAISRGSNADKEMVGLELKSAIDELKLYGAVHIIDDAAESCWDADEAYGRDRGHDVSVLGGKDIDIKMILSRYI